jgi:PadR family transcriptional regulator, regulatory protein PadR
LGEDRLGDFERHVLLAIVHLRGKGYAVSIADEIKNRTGKSRSFGAIYATADRLEKKGFVSSRLGEPTPERGGKPKRFYQIAAPGQRALTAVRAIDDQMWAGVDPVEHRHEDK